MEAIIPNNIMDAENKWTDAGQLGRELERVKNECVKLRRQNKSLVASLKEAKEILSNFGWTSSDSTEVILKAERWLANHPEEKK